jgi:hypothetical protein
MNYLQSAILQMKNIRFSIGKIAALLSLLAIFSTVSCAPSKSKSPSVPSAQAGVEATQETELENEDAPTDEDSTLEKTPAETETKSEDKSKDQAEVDSKPTDEIQSEKLGDGKSNGDMTQSPLAKLAGGGGAGDAGGGDNDRPSASEVRDAINTLTSNTWWIEQPLYDEAYKDPAGKTHLHMTVAPGNELLGAILVKMRNYLSDNYNTSKAGVKIDIKESGSCQSVDGKKEGSAKICDLSTPICLSIEEIQQKTPKASLTASLKSLIMHEYAHQHCADEALAKQVERYYDRPVVQNIAYNLSVKDHFGSLRKMLSFLKSGITTGMAPYKGKFVQKFGKNEICATIPQAATESQALQDMVMQSGFGPKTVRNDGDLAGAVRYMNTYCGTVAEPRELSLQKLNRAIQKYDQLAQEYSKNSGIIILDFSLHLFKEGGPTWGGGGEFDEPESSLTMVPGSSRS